MTTLTVLGTKASQYASRTVRITLPSGLVMEERFANAAAQGRFVNKVAATTVAYSDAWPVERDLLAEIAAARYDREDRNALIVEAVAAKVATLTAIGAAAGVSRYTVADVVKAAQA